MYKNPEYINLINAEVKDNKLYKSKNVKQDWNGKAQVKNQIVSLEEGIGFEFKNSLITENYEFAIGISTKEIDEIGYPNDLDYFLWIKTGNLGFVKLFKNYDVLSIQSNIHSSYKIELIQNNVFGFFIDNQLKYTFATDYSQETKLNIYVLLKNNVDYGINLEVNTDNIPEIRLLNVTPSLANKQNIFGSITLTFDNKLDPSTINKQNIFLREYNSKEVVENYSISYSDKSITVSFLDKPLDYNTTYEIYIPKGKIKSYFGDLTNDVVSITFTTIQEYEQPIEDKLGFSNNPNDIYYKLRKIYNLLDIDWINEEGDDFNFYYKPTKYNPIIDKYEIEYHKPYIFHNVKETSLEILRNDYLPEFDKFFHTVKKYISDTDFLNKLQALLIKNIVNINFFKGNRSQITFLIKLYAQLLDYTMVWVNPDPFLRFKYRVSTDVPYVNWHRDIKKITHPEGFEDKHIYIEKQIPHYYDNLEDKTKKLTSVFKKKYEAPTYIDVVMFKHFPTYNILPAKNQANAIWDDYKSTKFYPFRANKYNVIENTFTPDFHRELTNPFYREIKQIKHYQDDKSTFKLNYKHYWYGLDYNFNFTFNGVNLFKKLQPFLDFELKQLKYPTTLYLEFLHKNWKYPYRYKLLPYIHHRWDKKQLVYGINRISNLSNSNTIPNQISIKSFKYPYKHKFSFLINNYSIASNPNPIVDFENTELKIDRVGFYLDTKLQLIKNNKVFLSLDNIPDKIKIDKSIWDEIKVIFIRDDFKVEKVV